MYSNIKYSGLLEKNQKNIISLNEFKSYLRIDYEDEDNLLELLINSAYEEVENIIGKSILPQKWKQDVDLLLDNCDSDFLFEFPITNNAKVRIPLMHSPVTNVISVWSTKNVIDKEYYDIKINKSIPTLCINSTALIGTAQEKKVSIGITYETGIYKDVQYVPDKIKLSVLMLAADKFYQRGAVNPLSAKNDNSAIRKLLSEYKDFYI